MASEKNKAATRERMATEENKAATRERMATEENKAATRERMATERNKAATRQRMATEANRAADRQRKAAKTLAKDKAEKWPQAPLSHISSRESHSPGSSKWGSAMRPTCILNENLTLKVSVKCFPAPTFIWKKDGKMIGKEVSGGTPLQITMKAREAEPVASENRSGLAKTNSQENRDQPRPKNLPDFWRNGRHSISATWYFKWIECVRDHRCHENAEIQGPCDYKAVLARSASSELKICNTELGDAGTYSVQVKNLHGTTEHSFDIDFTPTLVKDMVPLELTVMAGTGSFKLEVEMSGGRVSWFKDGAEVQQEYDRIWELHGHGRGEMSCLNVRKCKLEDAGRYVAKTKTDAGSCISSACLVNVVEKAKGKTL